jgi:hypothetical protein
MFASIALSMLAGFDQFDSSTATADWGKPVTSNSSNSNGWSNFPQQPNANNPSRSNAIGTSNQWPEMNNFYGAGLSAGATFNLPQGGNDNIDSNRYVKTMPL